MDDFGVSKSMLIKKASKAWFNKWAKYVEPKTFTFSLRLESIDESISCVRQIIGQVDKFSVPVPDYLTALILANYAIEILCQVMVPNLTGLESAFFLWVSSN